MEEHVVLYRQFRPLTFDDVIGQKASVGALRQAVISGRFAHAYLFCGQHGTGKTTIAKIFSRAVNCEHPVGGNPCNECPTCKGILDGSILDVVEMDAASNNGVDDIRPILREVNFAPTRTKFKVYIIDEVHMLSKGAFNSLLKTIEEPPAHVIFLFATTEVEKIPATIISRCQRYEFRRIPAGDIVNRLRDVSDKVGIKIEDDALKLIASRSDGALRDALSLLDQISYVNPDKETVITTTQVEQITGTVDSTFLFKMANCLIDGHFNELVELCSALRDSGKNQTVFTLDLAAYFRDLLIIRVHADPLIYLPYPSETIKDMYQTANKVSADTLAGYISFLSKEYPELRRSPDIPTSFEIMLMRLCGRKSTLPVTPIKMPDTLQDSVPAKEKPSVKKEEPSNDNPSADKDEPSKDKHSERKTSLFDKFEKKDDSARKDESAEKEEHNGEESKKDSSSSAGFSYFSKVTGKTPDKQAADKDDKKEEKDKEKDSEGSGKSSSSEGFDLASFFSFTDMASSKKTEEQEPSKSEDKPGTGVFGKLSDSFLDDIGKTFEETAKKEEKPAIPVHTSQLAEQVSQSGIIVDGRPHDQQVRQPSFTPGEADIAVKWKSMVTNIASDNTNIASILEKSSLKRTDDSVYIVFDNSDARLMSNLKGVAAFKAVSSNIKDEFGAKHLYLCTQNQYANVIKNKAAKEHEQKLDEFKQLAESKGINTDIHFGD